MHEYALIWRIELTADNPQDAANQALAIMRDELSLATHFECRQTGQTEEHDVMICADTI